MQIEKKGKQKKIDKKKKEKMVKMWTNGYEASNV